MMEATRTEPAENPQANETSVEDVPYTPSDTAHVLGGKSLDLMPTDIEALRAKLDRLRRENEALRQQLELMVAEPKDWHRRGKCPLS